MPQLFAPRAAGRTLLLLAGLSALAFAQGAELTPHAVAALRSVTSAQISPDGSKVAYVLSVPRAAGKDEDGTAWTELHLLDVETGRSTPFITGEASVAGVAWVPGRAEVSFVTKRGKDKTRSVYTIPIGGGEARPALAHKTDIRTYAWSPDGKEIAFIAPDEEPEAEKKRKEKGFRQEVYEEDWRRSRILVAATEPGAKPREIAVDGIPQALEWSPSGDRLAVSVAPTPLVDDVMMRTRIHVVDAKSGEVRGKVANPGKLGQFTWSPDGSELALISAVDEHDSFAGTLMTVAATGGTPKPYLQPVDLDTAHVEWLDKDSIFTLLDLGLDTAMFEWKAPNVMNTHVKSGGPSLTAMSLSKSGQRAAFVGSTASHMPEVYLWKGPQAAGLERATNSNPGLDPAKLAPQEIVNYTARDGVKLSGVLIRPLNEEKGKRYPLVLCVHGGPEAHIRNGWLTSYSNPGQMLAAKGIAVFYPNYRGSTGRGAAFRKLSFGDPAGKEFDDLVDAVDHLVATGLADKDKVGITGGSYGGYATAWCSTRYTDRFAAGVMFVGISNKVSKVGTTDIASEEFLVHAGKRPWENWQFFLERSPIYYAQKSKTPLLILHGKDDPRVSPTQSRELYRHLKVAGNAPVRLVMYPGEEHGNQKAAARLDYSLRMVQWFEHYLKGPGGAPPPHEISYDAARKE